MTIFSLKKKKEEPKKCARKCRSRSKDDLVKKNEQERIDAFNDAVKDLAMFKKINGFIFLVDAECDKSLPDGVNGIRVWCGPKPVLTNLISCIDDDNLLKEGYEKSKLRGAFMNLAKLLDSVKEVSEKIKEDAQKDQKGKKSRK